MQNLIRAAVVACVLGVSGAAPADAAPLTGLTGKYVLRPNQPYTIKWSGGPVGGTVWVTIDRKINNGLWQQPYRWLVGAPPALVPIPPKPPTPNIPNIGVLTGVTPSTVSTTPCGPNVRFRLVVHAPHYGWAYGPTYFSC